ncbi:hypothetical protein PN462_06290 [Spirulina sp. CS-785/01]|uniref:hypothetical protein n=1 Tax=Spirulina sp. CS-785/01 TaxID=3021716 RepID=UPI00232AEC9F|nr:hypothetical protein [Spirulina sp. CS-785/01]MDB9312703.1 hypothetical protein [Spirulina sp. CS-785/01]
MMSKKRIAKFLELLHQQPSMFADCTQETWAELDQNLAQFGDEDYENIEDVILDWLDDHDYDAIKVALQNFRGDPDEKIPPPRPESEQSITNTALRSALKDAQNQQQQQSQSST